MMRFKVAEIEFFCLESMVTDSDKTIKDFKTFKHSNIHEIKRHKHKINSHRPAKTILDRFESTFGC